MILEIDEGRRRISLGMKQCQANPWEEFAANHNKGDKISGAVKSITDFGVFVSTCPAASTVWFTCPTCLGPNPAKKPYANTKRRRSRSRRIGNRCGKERISLGIKQLEGDPFGNFISVNDKGSLVKG